MREVDRALAHAFARGGRSLGPGRPATPPPPHLAPGTPAAAREPSSPGLRWPPLVEALARSYADRFERLADALIEARDRRGTKVVLVTSVHRAEGRSTLVMTVARALARRPGRTLLVDADLTGPVLARRLGLRPGPGLDDVVEFGRSLADALVEAPDDRLTVLPLRSAVSNPRGFLASPAWAGALARMRREFDLVLLDGGPLFAGLGSASVPPSIDSALLVHSRSRALAGDRGVLRARAALEAAGVPLLGLAETFVA